MSEPFIKVRGARTHNLKNIDADIPKNKITVISGVSGSGKSSLAMDTLNNEGRRRYIESLSPQIRHLLGMDSAADADLIEGLTPTISLDAMRQSGGVRSTAGTLSEIDHYIRLLFSTLARVYCPECGNEVRELKLPEICDEVMTFVPGSKLVILSPVPGVRSLRQLQERYLKQGFIRYRANGQITEMSSVKIADKVFETDPELVIDRLILKADIRNRLSTAIETALKLSNGRVRLLVNEAELNYSTLNHCETHGFSLPALVPGMFSPNNADSACTTCKGTGYLNPDEFLVCSECQGARLKPAILQAQILNNNIAEVQAMEFGSLTEFLNNLSSNIHATISAREIVKHLNNSLQTLKELGIDYLSSNRSAITLSGGEIQRLRLAAQLGAGLSGITYILDEPGNGLHGQDVQRLISCFYRLRDAGNTLILIEHNPQIIQAADWLIEMGPGAGEAGGEVLIQGEAVECLQSNLCPTALALKKPSTPSPDFNQPKTWLALEGVQGRHLDCDEVRFPIGALSTVCGISGSGKSSLISDLLAPALLGQKHPGLQYQSLKPGNIRRVIKVDQSPIGTNSRSTLATYSGMMDYLRKLWASLPESRLRGYTAGRFSASTKGGRCEYCEGSGLQKVEMYYLPDAEITCPKCEGRRYNPETLEILHKGLDLANALDLSVSDALHFFRNHLPMVKVLNTLQDMGLGYLRLGQSSDSLSGGESQRIRLARSLAKKSAEPTLFILDEPSRGLHLSEIPLLNRIFRDLCAEGHSVIQIEHSIIALEQSDWVIEMGPGAGQAGGKILFQGEARLYLKKRPQIHL